MRLIRILALCVVVMLPTTLEAQEFKTTTSLIRTLRFSKIASPLGERILTVTSTSDGVILAGTEGNGILRSTDGGDSWQSTSLRDGNIWPIHVAPGGTLFAFSTEGWMSRRAIFKSSDKGLTWTELSESSSRYFGRAIIASHGTKIYSEGEKGLHVSSDDGGTWTTLQSAPPMEPCLVDYRLEVLSDSVIFAMCYYGLFRSGDGGLSWSRIQTTHSSFSQLLPDPAGGVLIAATDTTGGNSLDELVRVSYEGLVVETIGPGPFWGGIRAGMLLDNGDFLAGSKESSETIMRSADSGRTWMNTSGIRAAVSDFCQCPDGTVFAATHGGLYRSHDHGITWEDCPAGNTRRSVRQIFDDGYNTIYAGTGNAGLFLSNDDCRTWTSAGTGYCGVLDGVSITQNHALIRAMHTQPSPVYSPSGVAYMDWWGFGSTLDLSWDGTRTWKQLNGFVNLLAQGRDSLVMTDDWEQNISTDGGNFWTTDSRLRGAKDIKALQGGIFVLTGRDSLFFRKDGITEWEFVTVAASGRAIGGDDFRLLLLEGGAIRRSTDGGMTWTSTMVENIFYHDPEIVTLDNGNLYAVTGIGDVTLLSSDYGETWNRVVPDGETQRFVYCAYTDSEGRLLLGTDDGLYRSATAVRGSAMVYTFHLDVPYPNPATSPVIIPYTLEQAGYVRLTIHDISGSEKGILYEGYQGPGTYFQGLHHTHAYMYGGAGLYFINLSVNGLVQTQPLVFPSND